MDYRRNLKMLPTRCVLGSGVLLYAIALIGPLGVAPATIAGVTQRVTLEPIIRVQDQSIVGCGLRASLADGSERFDIAIVIERTEAGRLTRLTAQRQSEGGSGHDTNIRLATASAAGLSSADWLMPSSDQYADTFEARARSDDTKAGILFQRLLVGGGEIAIETHDRLYSWKISGPAPNSVRAAYLMCAGDLYHPASEHQGK